jgi:hypothetical protein
MLLKNSRYTQPYETCLCYKVCVQVHGAANCTHGVRQCMKCFVLVRLCVRSARLWVGWVWAGLRHSVTRSMHRSGAVDCITLPPPPPSLLTASPLPDRASPTLCMPLESLTKTKQDPPPISPIMAPHRPTIHSNGDPAKTPHHTTPIHSNGDPANTPPHHSHPSRHPKGLPSTRPVTQPRPPSRHPTGLPSTRPVTQ